MMQVFGILNFKGASGVIRTAIRTGFLAIVTVFAGMNAVQACTPMIMRGGTMPPPSVSTPAFVGQVTSIRDNEKVTFKVLRVIVEGDGAQAGGEATVEQGHNSCQHVFSVGEWWLYAGTTSFSASSFLGRGDSPEPSEALEAEVKRLAVEPIPATMGPATGPVH